MLCRAPSSARTTALGHSVVDGAPSNQQPMAMPVKRQTGKAPPEAQSPKTDVDPQVMKVNTAYYARVQADYDVVMNCPQLLTLIKDELLPFPIAVLFFYTWLAGCWLWAHLGALGSWVWARLSRSLLRL